MPKPKSQTIIPPENGWKQRTLYLADVSFNEHNPIHRTVFFSGFLNGPKNTPGGYANVLSPITGESHPVQAVYYLKIVRELASTEDLDETHMELSPKPKA